MTTEGGFQKKLLGEITIGGEACCCTPQELDDQIRGKVLAQCFLEDLGTFYFVFEEDDPNNAEQSAVYLKFYNDEDEELYTSYEPVFYRKKNTRDTCVAVSHNTFLFPEWTVAVNDDWREPICTQLPSNGTLRNAIMDILSTQTSIHKTGLSRIRSSADTDFSLESEDGETVKVHKSVMEGLWPFFRGMVDSKMEESTHKNVKLSVPKSTLEEIVRYLYGEELELQFEDAANLIVSAQMYDLPELLELATKEVKKVEMSIEQAVYLWRKSFEARNEDVRDYASKRISKLMTEIDDFNDKIEHLEKIELVSLFQDISVALNVKRRKTE